MNPEAIQAAYDEWCERIAEHHTPEALIEHFREHVWEHFKRHSRDPPPPFDMNDFLRGYTGPIVDFHLTRVPVEA